MATETDNNCSITDVAKRAKVSTASVSRVLSGSPLVSARTREAVLTAAADMGYVPDPQFRLMAKRKQGKATQTGNFGIVLNAFSEAMLITDPYYARMFWSIERTVRLCGRHLITSTIQSPSDRYLPDLIKDIHLDGVLIVDQQDMGLIDRVRSLVPMVLVNAVAPNIPVSSVMADEAAGIRQAVDYLCQLGHRKIYYFDIHDARDINGQPIPHQHHDVRTKSFLAHTANTLPQARAIILQERTKSLLETVRDHLQLWRDQNDMPTALVCGADLLALAFLEAAEQLGIRVPQDLSVIGADDVIMCEYSRPKLTSIRQPFEAMGVAAVQMLVHAIENPDAPRTTQLFDVMLIKRDSCRAIHAENT